MPAKNTLSLGGNATIDQINRFATTPRYIMLIMLLATLSNILAAELVVYSIFVLVFAYICIFSDDLLPLMPIVICCYIAPSVTNNPGRNETSVFYPAYGGIYLLCIAAIAFGALLFRLIRDRQRFFGRKHKLLPGIMLLTAAYLLAGIGSKGYADNAPKSILFAFVSGASILVPYFVFSGGVRWEKARKDYLAWTGFGIGCALLLQVLWIYLTGNVIENGVIQRSAIYTGWGMYNNIGALLAIMIPFPFYLATQYRKGWIGTVVGSVFFIGVLLTCSRGSILCGGGIYFLCVVLMLYYANNRKANALALILFVGGLALMLSMFSRPLLNLFSSLLDRGLDPSNRDTIYRDGMKLFSKYPVFGGSFFSTEYMPWGWSTVEGINNFLPPRWHNTIVQLLASCGAVGFVAYLVHRVQTVQLFVRDRKPEKIFTAASIVALLACSLLDCHFFNIGPVLFYSMALAFAENN